MEDNEVVEGVVYRLQVDRIILHEKYNQLTIDYDIALLRLRRPLNSTLLEDDGDLGTVCLPQNEDILLDHNAVVAGWGTISEGGKLSSILRQVEVLFINETQCRSSYGQRISTRMICAGHADGGKDSCQGDSGGPLMRNQNEIYEQVGIVSWGRGCARKGYPGIYSRITSFLPWIHSHTADGLWCKGQE